ncbi:hypothetical protein [Bathymodiolus platifrons methanotrophic gill symbiont]|uniref:hypothetical protein n=1 Tax=Bathymodiolus platifrons methanotrophic gill symbiont TaxID=113268 RepID=UPI001C8D548B|nr:hypothetical protein [Bathymodiolus platifrons methanotrophic gill symbiont]
MPFFLSTPTLALRFRQNNGPTPSGDYQPSRSLSMAGSDGIETAHMIRKGQLSEENIPAYKQFMALAG